MAVLAVETAEVVMEVPLGGADKVGAQVASKEPETWAGAIGAVAMGAMGAVRAKAAAVDTARAAEAAAEGGNWGLAMAMATVAAVRVTGQVVRAGMARLATALIVEDQAMVRTVGSEVAQAVAEAQEQPQSRLLDHRRHQRYRRRAQHRTAGAADDLWQLDGSCGSLAVDKASRVCLLQGWWAHR